MNNTGVTYFEMGDYTKARENLEVAMALCLEMNYVLCGVESNAYLGAVTAATGDPEAGLQAIKDALREAELHGLKAQMATCRHLMGFVLAGQGKVDEGVAEIEKAVEEARALGLQPYIDRFQRTLKDIRETRAAARA